MKTQRRRRTAKRYASTNHRLRWPFRTAGMAIDPAAVEAAWQEYRASRSEAARDVLVERYLHLVRYMARRLLGAMPFTVDADDLVAAGIMGFLSALESFDPSRGVAFSTYALVRIRGAMVDFSRSSDPLGRATRRRFRAVVAIASQLEGELGRRPSESEIAERLGVSVEIYRDVMAQGLAASPHSLEALVREADDGGDGLEAARHTDQSSTGALGRLMDEEREAGVAALVAELSTPQQLVLQLHYVEDLRFREIGMLLDISEARASQYHARALLRLTEASARLAS